MRHDRHVVRVVAALIASSVIGGIGGVATGQVEDGLRFESHIEYRLEPDNRVVRVNMDIMLTHERPGEDAQAVVLDYVQIPVLAEATNVTAERVGGGSLQVAVNEASVPVLAMVTVDLSPNLRYGQTQLIRLTYELPDLPPRSEGFTRVNAAFSSLVILAVGSPGLVSIEVTVPEEFVVQTSGGPFVVDLTPDGLTLSADGIDPHEWWAAIVARNDNLLHERTLSVGDYEMTVRSWPGDDEWADFVEEYVTKGVPVLEELIGRPWPVEQGLEIIETSTPHLYGYGGWYLSADVIEMGDTLDLQLLLHELSHAWFNDEFSPELWVTEGLAQEYGYRAAKVLEGETEEPTEIRPEEVGIHRLRWWRQGFGSVQEAQDAQQRYRISWWVAHQLVEEIGVDAMGEVIGAALDGTIAYRGDPQPELWLDGQTDWRRILDLFEEVGASNLVNELYADYVMLDYEAPVVLNERSRARAAYYQLVEAGSGWSAPLQVRDVMSGWQFRELDALIDTATEVLASREAILELLDDLGIDKLPALEESYENAEDLEVLAEDAVRYLQLAHTISGARDQAGGAPGLLSRVGLLGADVDGQLRTAAAALAAGDIELAADQSERTLKTIDQSPLIGGLLLAQLLMCGSVVWLRRSRQPTALAMS